MGSNANERWLGKIAIDCSWVYICRETIVVQAEKLLLFYFCNEIHPLMSWYHNLLMVQPRFTCTKSWRQYLSVADLIEFKAWKSKCLRMWFIEICCNGTVHFMNGCQHHHTISYLQLLYSNALVMGLPYVLWYVRLYSFIAVVRFFWCRFWFQEKYVSWQICCLPVHRFWELILYSAVSISAIF